MKLNKIFRLSFVLVLLFQFSFIASVEAVTTSPTSRTGTAGQSVTIALTATPQAGENAVQVRITASNMTITNYTPPASGWIVQNADCNYPGYYNASNVCFTLGKSTDITNGESLGTITATLGSTGTATLTKASGTEYATGSGSRANTGTLVTYTISGSGTGGNTNTGGTLPKTGLSDTLYDYRYILYAALAFCLSILTYVIAKEKKANSSTGFWAGN